MNSLAEAGRRLLPGSLQRAVGRVEASPLGSRLARGSFWSLAGSVASRVLALAAAILAARILGGAAYGELGLIQGTIGMFGTLAGFGMGTTATKYIGEYRAKDPAKAGRILVLSSVVSWSSGMFLGLILISLASWLAQSALATPHLTPYLQVGALLLLLTTVNGAQTGVLSGFEAFRRIAGVNALAGGLYFPLVVGGALFLGLTGVLGGMILAQGIACLANYVAWRREAAHYQILIDYRSWISELPVVWQFAVPAVLGGLLMNPVSWACLAMLAHRPGGLQQVGAFSAANQWFGMLLWLPYVLSQAILPMLSERIGANDRIRSIKLLVASIKINAAIAFPIVLLGSLFSGSIMAAYGKDFAGDWLTLIVVLATAGVGAIQIPVGNVIAAAGRMWLGLCMNLLWSVVFFSGSLFLVEWGAIGLASARFLAYVAQGICALAYAVVLVRSIEDQSRNH